MFRLKPCLAAMTIALAALASAAFSATAQNTGNAYDEAVADIEKTLGTVPSYFAAVPRALLPSLWQQVKDLELTETALSAREKALISLAVGAQIPCEYCVWIDTAKAKHFGATAEEIREAVGVAAYTRSWSTLFHGLQIDLETFKSEVGQISD